MAHTVGKPVILVTQKREHVPFDLPATRYILYDYTPPGMAKVEAKLTETLRTELKILAAAHRGGRRLSQPTRISAVGKPSHR